MINYEEPDLTVLGQLESGHAVLGAKAEAEIFRGVDFKGVAFLECVFTSCKFIAADMQESQFLECKFFDCEFTDCSIANISVLRSEISSSSFVSCKGNKQTWLEVRFKDCKMSDFSYEAVHLVKCIFEKSVFSDGRLFRFSILDSSLDHHVFDGMSFEQGNVLKTKTPATVFKKNCNIDTMLFHEADFDGHDWQGM